MNEQRLRVMLVDDSPFDRGMIRRELISEFGNVSLIEVIDRIEFDNAIAGEEFDLVITDFQIRWTDGLEVLQTVKAKWRNCPVVMFTATGSEEIAVKAMKCGLEDYVIKNAHHFIRLRVAARSALEHARTRKRADQLESRIATLLSHLQVGVFRRRADGTIIEANQAAALILGHSSPSELSGTCLLDYLNTPDPASAVDIGQNPMVGAELSICRIDGAVIRINVTEHKSDERDGEAHFEGIFEDVTARRQTEDELICVYDHMAHLARINTMAEMAAGISHELNQPLSAISNYAAAVEIAMSEKFAGDKSHDDVRQIQELACQCGQIIRGLRDFTHRRPRQQEMASIGELIRKSVEMLQFEIRGAGVELSVNLSETDAVFEGDCVQIQQVLVNLVSNAIDAIQKNETSSQRLSINVVSDEGQLEVQVVDTGTGIPASIMTRLFGPFVTSKPDGTGIGLSISSRIIEAHGGTLDAWNNEQQGATFRFTLPVYSGVGA